MIVPKQLISMLNSGRCIAIVGSGPSCEMGYPSWGQLAEKCIEHAKLKDVIKDHALFSRLMGKRDYPNVFKYLQTCLQRQELLSFIESQLVGKLSEGKAYKILAQWPFRYYLTTNWDNEIQSHLSRIREHFTRISNSKSEITEITDETSKQVIMLHGVLSDIESVVLTEDDYQAFKSSDNRRYFREKLKSILNAFPIVVIGHSLSDPDLQIILEAAKQIAPLHRPIYMIAGDPEKEDFDKYYNSYNIHLIGYKKDPNYASFFRLLAQIDKFVVPRAGCAIRHLDPPKQDEIEVATSLLVFNSMSKSLDDVHLLDKLVCPQILQLLKRSGAPMQSGDFLPLLIPEALKTLASIQERVDAGLERLRSENLIAGLEHARWTLTSDGDEMVSTSTALQRIEDDQVYGSLTLRLKEVGVSPEDCERASGSLRSAILSVFRRRGIAATSLVFRGQNFEPIDMEELFESITGSIEWSGSFELREAFIEFAMRMFSSPTAHERRYLARVSQGLFAVHVFGMDPVAVDARIQIFKNVSWFFDSNIIIPLIAIGSSLNEMAVSICEKCKQLGIRIFVTKGVIDESLNSLNWASRMCESLSAEEEMQFIYQVANQDGYRPNPFIDGFVRSQYKYKLRRFAGYRSHIGIDSVDTVIDKLLKLRVKVIGIDDLSLEDNHRVEFDRYKNTILAERERRGTSSGEFQASVEAEVLCLILSEREKDLASQQSLKSAYFVSTSRLLDQIYGDSFGSLTWSPEVLFKHLSLISPSKGDTETLIESIGTELAELGVTLVDQDAYRQYFDPLISSSRMSFDQERSKYVDALRDESGASAEDLQREFDATADIGKPRFVSRMQWRVGNTGTAQLERQLGEARRRQDELAAKLKASEEDWQEKHRATVQHYENRFRNLSDPVRRKKLNRKTRNKAKKRKKGK